ncbi:hypothetical protein VMCG_07239 [Cytospora schulzeri]|uniref:MYND-type domain-containing protein n=1 Tax=Cytospora schulzeri TaxID=448051 RepID=A0A423WAE1_9PEZI|nr:hypothetical protein VMCG_07239 [Valsa malicola]
MEAFHNMTAFPPGTSPNSLLEAIQKNNAANLASEAGRHDEAIALHKQALEAKVRDHGEESVHAALSLNSLGEEYLEVGRLDEAAQCFRKALRVRDDVAFGGLELGPRNDAAATRDNMGRVLEARGDFEGAREIRIKGADKGHTMCGCVNCLTPGGAMLTRQKLKTCGGCRSVFYCSAACQKKDWTSRHKPLCKKYTASRAAANSTA